jgi:hypothetical protein
MLAMFYLPTDLAAARPLPLLPPPTAATARASRQTELAYLVQRLTRLVQEMGDQGFEPNAYGPLAYLRGPYVQLSQEATHLVEQLGLAAGNAVEYLGDLLVAELRATTRGERRAQMSLPQALGE